MIRWASSWKSRNTVISRNPRLLIPSNNAETLKTYLCMELWLVLRWFLASLFSNRTLISSGHQRSWISWRSGDALRPIVGGKECRPTYSRLGDTGMPWCGFYHLLGVGVACYETRRSSSPTARSPCRNSGHHVYYQFCRWESVRWVLCGGGNQPVVTLLIVSALFAH